MPAYHLTGFSWDDDFSSNRSNFSADATLSLYVPEGTEATITFDSSYPGSFFVSPDGDGIAGSWVDDGTGTHSLLPGFSQTYSTTSYILYDMEWAGNHTTALITIRNFADGTGQRRALFVLDGAPLPEFANAAELTSFYDTLTARTAITSGPFAMGTAISLSAIPTLLSGSPLEIFGTDGNDLLAGTTGADIFHPGHNTTLDAITLQGGDLVDLTGATQGDHYRLECIYEDDGRYGLEAYFDATRSIAGLYSINDIPNAATIVGAEDAMRAGALQLIGSAYDDYFLILTQPDSFLSIQGGAGEDYYALSGTGSAELDFSDVASITVEPSTTYINVITHLSTFASRIHLENPDFTLILRASFGADLLTGDSRDDIFIPLSGNDTINGAGGFDTLRYDEAGMSGLVVNMGASRITGSLNGVAFTQQISNIEAVVGAADAGNRMTGRAIAEHFTGGNASDTLDGGAGNDTLEGGDGTDTLLGGDGNDSLLGGATAADLRDMIYGGAGNDSIDGGYGNDSLRGDDGNDTIEGGFGADTVVGGAGNDQLSGSAWSDLIFGNDGDDFLNGGFGNDRESGGAGADRFYHLGVVGHGADWVQDYAAAEGDRLAFGNTAATRDQFQINWAATPGAGDGAVQEAFVVYRPTGQVIWALVDGAAQEHIWLQVGTSTYDLLH